MLDAADAFEVRVLTVAMPWRGTMLAALLMYAALRWVESRGGRQVVAMALSGMRVAYLTSNAATAAVLRRWTPPWAVSLPAQLAAVAALRDPAYYAARWAETKRLRADLAAALRAVDPHVRVEEAVANFLLITLPAGGPSAAEVVAECRLHDVYIRDLSPMSPVFQGRTVRIAVKDPAGNARVVAGYEAALAALAAGHGEAGAARPVGAATR